MSFQIGKIKGVPIKLHFTLLIVFALISWTVASAFMPQLYPNLSTLEYYSMGITAAVILFGSVLLHEVSHSIVATNYGIKVRQIILFIFGGVSDISEESKNPKKEFNISFAGPATSFALSALFAAAWYPVTLMEPRVEVLEGVLFYGAVINLILGGFNLIPAFPLDGGRILRAALAKKKKDYAQATRIAVNIGIAISYGFMGLGFFILITGNFIGGIWIALIGWFLNSGAQAYKAMNEITESLSRVRLVDIMNTRFTAVPAAISIKEAKERYFSVHMKRAFPVLNESGRLVGMISTREIQESGDKETLVPVGDVITPLRDLVVMDGHRKADDAFMMMSKKGSDRVFVCDEDGRLKGLVSKTDFLEVVREREEYRKAIAK